MSSVTVYVAPKKKTGLAVGMAFAYGCGGGLSIEQKLFPGIAAFWGINHHVKPMYDNVLSRKLPWIYLDNAYFHHKKFFRATSNEIQFTKRGNPDWERWKRLDIKLKPWQTNGKYILVCPPGELFSQLIGFDTHYWAGNVISTLKLHTDRRIKVRWKPYGDDITKVPSFQSLLKDAYALVTYMSNTAVEALIEGVPIFIDGPSAVKDLGTSDLFRIEYPFIPERAVRLAALSAQQWTIEEMRDGLAWKELSNDIVRI